MKKMVLLLFLPLLGVAFSFIIPTTRGSYPLNYFSSPVGHTLLLSGTFGELRPNHFHAGIDIKSSRGVIGDPVLAAADGYIAKIRVEESGYGNSLYVNHPNGFTTLYAHLENFTPEVEDYVRRQQYARQTFALDLVPGEAEFPVRQGEQIGVMGNTGSSNGAHLHFEVRETKTQNAINPLLFGFNVTDNIAPRMHAIKAYLLNEKREEKGQKTFPVYSAAPGRYKVKGDTLSFSGERIGLALKVFDHFNSVSNWNGIYSVAMLQDDSLTFDFDFESFSFDETRYINAHCDYLERITKNSYYNRLYTLPGNQMSIYKKQKDFGVVHLAPGKTSKITIIAADAGGNSSRLEFFVKRNDQPTATLASNKEESFNYVFPYGEGNIISTEGLYLHLPKGTLYQDLYLHYETSADRSSGHYSQVHHVGNDRVPIHGFFDIGIRPTMSIPAELKPKVFVGLCDGGSVTNCGGKWQDGFLRTKVRSLGDYCILVDVTPPSVRPILLNVNMKSYKKMSFKISDNVTAAPNVKGLTYDAWIDGEWVLLEFDKKTATISHTFDEYLGKGEHDLKLVVRDAVGNETVLERKFSR